MIEQRKQSLADRLQQMREMDEWHLFQNFVLGLLAHEGYTDVRLSAVRNDYGRDGVALTPDKKKCFVAVSFDCSLTKIRHDAKRWTEDPNREDADVILFAANDSPQNTKVSRWKKAIKTDYGLELRLFNRETIFNTATHEGVWRETCARLGIPGHRQGYVKVSPYDGELVRRALKARPPEWLRQHVELPQWDELATTVRSRLIFGKPGSGKTTTIFEQLQRAKPETVLVVESDLSEASQMEGLLDEAAGEAVLVFDDVHEDHKRFVSLCTALRTRKQDLAPRIARQYENVIVLAATRSQEWEAIRPEIPLTVLEDLGLLGKAELTLKRLDTDQCKQLIEICRDEWGLLIEERLLEQAAQAAAERDATPLYVISVLAAARGRDDRTLLDEHLAGLPANVRDLWRRYWRDLDATSQGVLRLVRLFLAATVPPQPHLLQAAAKSFDISPSDLAASLDALERSLWLTRTAGVPSCLDVQLEVIDLDYGWYELWDRFVFDIDAGVETRIQLHNGTGGFYHQHVAPRTDARKEYGRRLADAARHFETLGVLGRQQRNPSVVALALSNASILYSDLAKLETTHELRRSRLTKSVDAVEEAISIRRDLGEHAALASSLNNASSYYSDLAALEATREGRRSWLTRAVESVEKAVCIYRELGVRGELATSLNNVSVHYSSLAGLETTRQGRRSWLTKGVEAVEESVRIYRELGLRGELAGSLSNASNGYGDLADLEATREGRRSWLVTAVDAVEESVRIRRKLGLRGDLAMSLNNASIRYGELARVETTCEGQRSGCVRAVDAMEESVLIFRELGVLGDLANSLNNASNRYSDLAGLQTTREGRRSWLARAIEAVEESVRIRRELGVRGELAMSLGALCQHQRDLAEAEVDPDCTVHHLELSREAIDEAVTLFRDAGNTPHLLMSLQDAVTARLMLVRPGVALNVEDILKLVDEGLALAKSMEDEKAIEFFAGVKRMLAEGGNQA